MRFHTEKKHVIDLIFPIALFFVFAACSLIVVLMASNIYSSTTRDSETGFETRTALSYVTEKIHQSDENGDVSISEFDGLDALAIHQEFGGSKSYTTYIYEYEGSLRELFIQDGVNASASDGKEILKVKSFTMKQISTSILEFSCTSSEGDVLKTAVTVKSTRGGL